MDHISLLYWLGFLVKILAVLLVLRLLVWGVFYLVDRFLGLSVTVSGWRIGGFESLQIKYQRLELQVNGLHISLRWFDRSCRHFFKVNIKGTHVEYAKTPGGGNSAPARPRKTRLSNSLKKRLFYSIVRRILKWTEVSVKCLEVWVQDYSKEDVTPGAMLQGQLSIIAKPLPQGELGLSLDVENMLGQLFVQLEQPCTYTEDGLYPLADFKFCAKTVLFLQPLSLKGGLVKSVQLNVVPLTLSLSQQGLLSNLLIDYQLSSQPSTNATPPSNPQQRLALLPEKVEVVLENVSLLYQALGTSRVLSSKVTRVSVAAALSLKEDSHLPSMDASLGVQDLKMEDSHSRRAARLQQLRLVSKMTSKELTNKLHIDSLNATLWEEEVLFWYKYARETLNKIKVKLKSRQKKSSHQSQQNSPNLISYLFKLPLSVVTSFESSDWSIQLHSEAPALQAKEPLCRIVMATCAGNVQWDSSEVNKSTLLKSSLRLANAYLHVPGYHPTVDNPTFFRQRPDNPQALPSLHSHLWGRVISIGALVLKSEREVQVSDKEWVWLGEEGVSVRGEGSSVMLEWSQPTVVAMVRVLEHLKTNYGMFKREGRNEGVGRDKKSTERMSNLPQIDLELQLTDINLFLYALTPEPPTLMVRLDAGSLSTTPSPSLTLHRLLLDDMHLSSFTQVFVCSDTANLPHGAGVLCVGSTGITYDPQIQDVSLTLTDVTVSWSTTAHRCIFRALTCLQENTTMLRGVLGIAPTPSPRTAKGEMVAVGDVMQGYLQKLPVSLNVRVNKANCVGQLDKRIRVYMSLTNIQSSVNGGVFMTSSQEIAVTFDHARIMTLLEFITRFPQEEGKMVEERKGLKYQLQQQSNSVLWLQAYRLDLIFPHDYNFSLAYDKLTNVRKFLQKLHSGSPGSPGNSDPSIQYLLPDVSAECEDIVLQVSDDPFEMKLRANYELLCDEAKEKSKRREAFEEKLSQVRQEQGVTAVSGEKVQSLYASLEVTDSEIYCQRAKTMYSCPEEITTGLFTFSMEHTKLGALFDPTLLGEENLVKNLREIDAQSPLPEGYSFSTLFGCYVTGSTDKLQMQVRDYPAPLIAITEITTTGRMVLAEQEARDREVRSAVVEVGHPWSSVTVKRKLPPLKYYYDLEMTSETWDILHGPCLEPALAQTSIGLSRLSSPTIDPSRPLPYWDKLRLLFHGPIHLSTKEMRVLLPSTFNPYNDVEYLEIRMCELDLKLLTNTQLNLEGALQLNVHTASKYNDCCILDFPHVKSSLKLNWVCGGKSPHDHHHVVRCAPDRVPVLPDNQVHDSYSLFRSQNLDVEWKLDVQPQDKSPPEILLYSSTLRCLQQYQALVKWNVTRPTRRGVYFKNLKPKRPPILRHVRDVKVSVSFPETSFHYWSSGEQQRGVECSLQGADLAINYLLKLVPLESGLTQRPRANWTVVSCRGKVGDLVSYVKQRSERKDLDMEGLESESILGDDEDHTRSILLSLEELVYSTQEADPGAENSEDDFMHQLETKNTKLLWNLSNKRVVLGLYDAYKQAQMLKRDLSAEALKFINKASPPELPSDLPSENVGVDQKDRPPRPSSGRMRQPSSGNTMLDQLLADIGNTFVSYVDERAPSDPLLKGVAAGSMNDVRRRKWIVTLTNTQIALQVSENSGFALASSHVAQVFGREHHPQLMDGDLISKSSWVGKIQELQYFSTACSASELDGDKLTIPWLPLSVICPPLALTVNYPEDEQTHTDDEAALNILLGKLGPSEDSEKVHVTSSPPGEAVGGLVSCVLMPESEGVIGVERSTVQLQRIASRCHCQVFYVSYGEVVEGNVPTSTPGSPPGGSEYRLSPREAVDTLTVRYPSVDVCTTSSQHAMIMDILNNLLLNKEPKKKEATDRKARMQFTLQLANIEDPRRHVQNQQSRVRKSLQTLRELQTRLFLETRENQCSEALEEELYSLIDSAKEDLSITSNTLRAMIRAFKQNQLYLTPTRGQNDLEPADPIRRIEIWVDDARWWLTQDDGQLQVANICFTNFSYNRVTFSNDSGEHRFELGTFSVRNLMPNTRPIYQHVLHPYDPNSKHLRVDKNICLRVYCKDKAPVAGISVKEHLEVNVVPLSVSLTAKFYQTMQDFFFPKAGDSDQTDRDHGHLFAPSGIQPSPAFGEPPQDRSSPLLSRASSIRSSVMSVNSSVTVTTATNHSPPTSPVPKEVNTNKTSRHSKPTTEDAVDKMKERASQIKTFIYVKIPQCAVCVNYKSENVSLKDIQNGRFTIPTLEYHNKNWTWTDMLMEVKKDIKTVIVQQTLKSVVGMKETDERAGLASPKMPRKGSDMLLGSLQAKVAKSGKKLFSKLASKDGQTMEEPKSSGPRRSSRLTQTQSRDSKLQRASSDYLPPLSESADRTISRNTPSQDSL